LTDLSFWAEKIFSMINQTAQNCKCFLMFKS
jgi:hypothetical protein